jgi:hypothetical protein
VTNTTNDDGSHAWGRAARALIVRPDATAEQRQASADAFSQFVVSLADAFDDALERLAELEHRADGVLP